MDSTGTPAPRESDDPPRYLIIDLEATCWDGPPPGPSEVIEIGAVMYEVGRGSAGEFQRFVRPVLHPVLSPFCCQLTSIAQEQVDAADPFPQALAELLAWAEPWRPYTFASWGDYDQGQVRRDCARHGVAYPFGGHCNLKKAFANIKGKRPTGMAHALKMIGRPLDGVHHRGIDDARNIAAIVGHLFESVTHEVFVRACESGAVWGK